MSIKVESQTQERVFWKGSLLVAGTCIGGGMLVMPIQTGAAGFFVSAAILLTSWAFMTFTGLLLIEATLWLKNNTHFSSMAQTLLGRPAKILSLIVYLFMNTASLVAYTNGGALLMDSWIHSLFGLSLGYTSSCVLFTLLFGWIVYLGVSCIAKMNGYFTLLMAMIYCCLIGVGFWNIKTQYLAFRPQWIAGFSCFPLILAAFSYQMIVPSLCSYMNYQVRELKKALVLGTTLPCAVYLLWLLVIHGMIPFEGAGGLQEALITGALITGPLGIHFNSGYLALLTDLFAFLALTTSYLGLSLALFDFVRDLFKEVKLSHNAIIFLSLAPSLSLAILFPMGMLAFLDISGGFGDTILSCLIPVGMVWVGRYRKKLVSEYQAPGGKSALLIAGTLALAIFAIQWIKLIWE